MHPYVVVVSQAGWHRAAVAGLDPRLAEPLHLDDLTARARLLCDLVAGIG